MPVALEPGVKNPLWLKSDAEKPEESRPTFYCRALSMRHERELRELLDWLAKDKAENDHQLHDRVSNELSSLIVGWENLIDPDTNKAIPFGKDTIEDVLTLQECFELLNSCYIGTSPNPTEKKSSESPA